MSSHFELRSRWQVPVGREALWSGIDALLASDDPMVWWPSVQVSEYDGSTICVRARSHIGYTLTFALYDLHTRPPRELTFAAVGDLAGHGRVQAVEDAENHSHLDINWQVETKRPWMRRTVWLLRPLFVLGHDVVMRQGEKRFAAWVSAQS